MKRLLAMLLAVVMLVGVLPTSVFATEVTDPTAPVVAAEVVSEPTEEATEEATEAATTVTEPVLTVAKTSVQNEAVAASEDADVAPAANDSVVVIAGSDYQQSGSTAPKTTVTNILSKIKADYTSADGFMFGGDYYQNTLDTTTASKNTDSGGRVIVSISSGTLCEIALSVFFSHSTSSACKRSNALMRSSRVISCAVAVVTPNRQLKKSMYATRFIM